MSIAQLPARREPGGVRIQHPTERNRLFTMVDGKRPYQQPYPCVACGRTHTFKTYHITLDDVGAAIVSYEILARLKQMPDMAGFRFVNVVHNPPAQIVVPGAPISRGLDALPPIVEHPQLKEPV